MNLVCAYILLLKSVSVKVTNPYHATGPFLYPLKTSENQSFSNVLGGIEREQWHEMVQVIFTMLSALGKKFCKNSHFLVKFSN